MGEVQEAPGRERPRFPVRAVVTAGMPYGNKDLHFGHVGGVFVPADMFARFLRDRIGKQNVIFVSGTDCYGSPVVEDHRKQVERGDFSGSLEDFVQDNHQRQTATLAAYRVQLDLYAASSLPPYLPTHQRMGAWFLETLHKHGFLERRSTPQFFDADFNTFLNGRQVTGRCPVIGCKSEHAYADECSLGHQYEPKDLIAPTSTLSGKRPETRQVTNWYVRTNDFREILRPWLEQVRDSGAWRSFAVSGVLEYFEPPIIHVTRDQQEALEAVRPRLAPHELHEGKSQSVQLVFEELEQMERSRTELGSAGLRYRVGKTIVPFRLTGNLRWGLPAPAIEGLSDLTFWVWPESLWAPISFVCSCLTARGGEAGDWRSWWCSSEAEVYQFIGEDNIYFYGLAQGAMFLGTHDGSPSTDPQEGALRLTRIVANRHMLFLDKKASSSGTVRPPLAGELLQHYTVDQLRTHFLSLNLAERSVSFRPKPFNPTARPGDPDPVLKEGALLCNSFNRAARSCFYTAQKFFDGCIPEGQVSRDVIDRAVDAALTYEAAMAAYEFHRAIETADVFIREINQRWTRVNPYHEDCQPDTRRQSLLDALHMVRVAAVLMHPVAPVGAEMLRQYFNAGEEFWHWEYLLEPITALLPCGHQLRFLEPKMDFFEKLESQLHGQER